MKQRTAFRLITWAGLLPLMCCVSRAEQPSQGAEAGFDRYVRAFEARLAVQHRQEKGFIALTPHTKARLRRGEVVIENQTSANTRLPGATLYDWRGTAFAPNATAADFEHLMRDFTAYPRIYSPQVLSAKVLSQSDNHYQITMRIQQKHVITIVMNTIYNAEFGQLDARHGWSTSRSTRIDEIENGRALSPTDQHGFLWRLNTYWAFEERDGGLYMQIESISLTRSVPLGLCWVVGPLVESIPRDSLEFTLRATRDALRK